MGRQNEGQKRSFSIRDLLGKELAKRCTVYHHDQQPEIRPARAKQFPLQRCRQVGVCVCGEHAPIQFFLDRFKAYLVAHFNFLPGVTVVDGKSKRVPSELRGKLRDRMVVLQWRCADVGSDDDCHRQPQDVQDSDLFWYLGHVNFNTMHVAGLQMQPCQLGQQEVLQLVPAEPVQGQEHAFSHGVCTDAEWIGSRLDLQKQWVVHVCCISLVDSHWTADDMTPVPVVWHRDTQPFKIWSSSHTKPPSKKQKGKREASSHRPAVQALQDRGGPAPSDLLERLLDKKPARRASVRQPVQENPANPAPVDSGDLYLEVDAEVEGDLQEDLAINELLQPEESEAGSGSPNDCSSEEENDDQQQAEDDPVVPVPDAAVAAAAAERPAARAERPGGPRDMESTQVFETSSGTLRFYPQHEYVTAFCRHHFECRRSRTVKPKTNPKTPAQRAQGRCVGALCAWLEQHERFPSQHQHVHSCIPTATERCEARRRLYALPGGRDFASSCERPKREGEDEEPAVFR